MAELVLTDWSDAALGALLRARPDLAAPLPGSLTALTARAVTARSAMLAIARLDSPTLAVLDSVVALAALGQPTDAAAIAAACGVPDTARVLADLAGLALVVPDGVWWPAGGVAQARGEFPAGLAVGVAATTVAGSATVADHGGAAHPALPSLGGGARRVLDALTWTRPVGAVTPGSAAADAVSELLAAGLVRPRDEHPGEHPGEVVLPGATGLALRGGRTHRDVPLGPPVPDAPVIPHDTVVAEAARAALDVLHDLDSLARLWGEEPAAALRSGGLGVREVRRAAQRLDVAERRVALLAELAALAGEIGRVVTPEESLWAPVADALPSAASTTDAPDRERREPLEHALSDDPESGPEPAALRWAGVTAAWWRSPRVLALAGTSAPDGSRQAPLDPGLERAWAVPLRRRVLEALAGWPAGSAPDLAAVQAHLAWATPAAPPPEWAVRATLEEAEALGLTGAGALAATGRALLTLTETDADNAPGAESTAAAETSTLADALQGMLPRAVGNMVVQADLTAVVPGRPTAELLSLIEATATVESRGGALTARFTPASLARAVERGMTSDQLLTALTTRSRTPLPQALEYAVRDAERRYGSLRVGSATSFLRSEDPALLAELAADHALGLRLIAPSVAVSRLAPARLADLLRAAGRGVLAEGLDGAVVHLDTRTTAPHPLARPRTSGGGPAGEAAGATAGPAPGASGAVEASDAVARLRRGQARLEELGGDGAGALARLRAAARTGESVLLSLAGASGEVTRRRVLPLQVSDGVVRARDLERETDLTVAAHRIVAVAPAS